MCGIAGWVGTQHTTAADHLLAMLKPLSKRGPEAQNIWQTTNAILGHTRLSIIDIEKSTQPCANEDGSVVVTYNGEIYNYRSLRQSCIDKGHTLATDGDTETLVHLYEDYQSQYIDKLDGMFAFGLYDTNHQRLLLARDRIGIKPLYYWYNQYTGELVFASDLSAMLANPC